MPSPFAASLSSLLEWLGGFRRERGWILILLVANLLGVAYGFYYYGRQFVLTPPYLWPLVPDSPLAVLLIVAALLLALAGRQNRWIDAFAFVANVKVGLWTAFVLLYYGPEFRIFDEPLLNLNFYLFWLHLGMAAEAFVLVRGMRHLRWGWLAVAGWFAFSDAMDYGFPGFEYAGCVGTRPITVPCRDFDVLIPVTIALTAASLALAWWMARRYGVAGNPSRSRLQEPLTSLGR
ncbi:MAG TPA: DUF1405 domain-containing protein [Candidatus Thermoplasmatota archaeon]|nr:DUF1405 domain-containing protein [Candidatus Thermoplasmatota archaeon]